MEEERERERKRSMEKFGMYMSSRGGMGSIVCSWMYATSRQSTADYCFNINNIENTFDRLLEQTSNIQCNLHGCACCAFKMWKCEQYYRLFGSGLPKPSSTYIIVCNAYKLKLQSNILYSEMALLMWPEFVYVDACIWVQKLKYLLRTNTVRFASRLTYIFHALFLPLSLSISLFDSQTILFSIRLQCILLYRDVWAMKISLQTDWAKLYKIYA